MLKNIEFKLSIQDLIIMSDAELGEKLKQLLKTSDGINKMVEVIADHLGESIKQGYELGLKEGTRLTLLNK